MKFLNWDELVEKKLGKGVQYKKNEWFLPKNPSHYIMVGSTGSGKTSLLLDMLLKWMNYDEIILVAKMTDEPKYEFLQQIMDEIQAENKIKQPLFTAYDNIADLPEVQSIGNDERTRILIVDDMVNEKNQKKFSDYWIAGRKKGVSCFYLSQRYTDVPKMIRNNAQFYIFFTQRNKEQQLIYQDLVGSDMDIKEFKQLFKEATQKRFSFMSIDMTRPEMKYRKGLDEFYIPKQQGTGIYDVISTVGNVVKNLRSDPETGLTLPIANNHYCGPLNSISSSYQAKYPPGKEPLGGVCFRHDVDYDNCEKLKGDKQAFNNCIKEADEKMLSFLDNYQPNGIAERALKAISYNGIRFKKWTDSITGAGTKESGRGGKGGKKK